jgi:hypothetical protein
LLVQWIDFPRWNSYQPDESPAMSRLLCVLSLALMFGSSIAQNTQPEPPLLESGMLGTVIFGILFLVFCLGFVWFVWKNEKARKEGKGEGPKPKA